MPPARRVAASPRPRPPSPILDAAAAMIGEAADVLVPSGGRFRHSFEAPVEAVAPDPAQARGTFDEGEIEALAATMAAQGQLQPILVRPDPAAGRGRRWVIVAGERRWRAARRLGWGSVLAIEHEGDHEVASLVENLQRVDLNPVEEARGLRRLIDGKGWSQGEAARALGRSKGAVSAVLRILDLPEELLERVLTSELPVPKNALVELARVEEPAARERLLALAREGALTVRAVREVPAAVATSAPRGRAGSGQDDGAAAERLARRLRAAREAGRGLGEGERDRLEALGREIRRRLAAA